MKSNVAMRMTIAMSAALFLLMTTAPTVALQVYGLTPEEDLLHTYASLVGAQRFCDEDLFRAIHVLCKKITPDDPVHKSADALSMLKSYSESDVVKSTKTTTPDGSLPSASLSSFQERLAATFFLNHRNRRNFEEVYELCCRNACYTQQLMTICVPS